MMDKMDSPINMVYIHVFTCLLGYFFVNFGIAMGEFLSQTYAPNLHKLGEFCILSKVL